MTGFAQSAALSIRNRLKPAIRGLSTKSRIWASRAAAIAATIIGFLRNAAARAIERIRPGIAWTSRRLQPWIALLQDVAAVAASLARPVIAKATDLVRPVVAKVVERFGLRVTVMATATAIFIGSTGSAALAITNIEEPTPGTHSPGSLSAIELALSNEGASAAAEQIAAEQRAAAAAAAEAEAKAAAEAAAKAAAKPKPVGGLSELQMENAVAIIEAGKEEGLGRDAWAVALATAMQESKFRNYANVNVPESYNYAYQAEGSDHDSVGLFQQRLSWGKVEDLMNPKKSAKKFYRALERVDGWEDMPVTVAAQTVQVSAFPDAYAQWEDLAWDIVKSYEKAKS